MVAFDFVLRSTLALSVIHSVAARPTLEVTPNPKRRSILRRDADADANPDDQSWVKNWAAVGDSYAAGIGAGERLGGLGDYFCSRTDQSYPNQINTDPRLGGGQKFTFWACSGAVIDDVVQKQIPSLDSGLDFMTLSAGGNDLNLTTILNYCVFTWNDNPRGFFEGGPPKTCERYLDDAKNYLGSDELSQKLDKVISDAKGKLSSDGKLYYTGYGRFFGEDDNQCDSVSWSFWWGLHWQYLTTDRRKVFNELVDGLNNKIKEATDRAGDQVIFVDWSSYVEDTMGRFCEKGFPETDDNRLGLLFYEYYTDDNKDPDNLDPRQEPSQSVYLEGTFEYTINALVQDYMQRNDTGTNKTTPYETFAIASTQPDPKDPKFNAADDQKDLATIQSILPDSYTRVFHPRPFGYSIIANLVFYHMAQVKAEKINFDMPPEVGSSDTCDAPTATNNDPPAPTESGNYCVGNQVTGDCIAGQFPSAAPFSGPRGPSCLRPGDDVLRLNEDKVLQTVQEWCQLAIDDGLVISADNTAPKPGTMNDVAENGGIMDLVALYDVASCPESKEFDKYDFGVMGIDRCVMDMGQAITQTCSQDSTWGDYNKDYTVMGGVVGIDCVMWSIGGRPA